MGKPKLPEMWLILCLIVVRVISIFINLIYDCDETYNYWEIGHYLIYKNGFLTWEYSPKYALRSYFYIWSYIWPSYLITCIYSRINEIILFYLTRFFIACFGIFCEVYFCVGIGRCAGSSVARYTIMFLMLSSGMFLGSTAFLPNTFSMHLTMIAFAAWFCDHYRRTIFAAGLSILVGWPYAALVYVPIATSMLIKRRKQLYFIVFTLLYGFLISLPIIAIDRYYYGRFVMTPLNAVIYNVLNPNAGPNLYGVESWTYYMINLTLNFNLVFWASLLSLPMLILSQLFLSTRKHKMVDSSHWICVISLMIWLIVFTMQAHKEERFMYPIYPLICASAAFTVRIIEQFVAIGTKSPYSSPVFKVIVIICCLAFFGLSLSRVASIYFGYRSTFSVYSDLKKHDKDGSIPMFVDNRTDTQSAPKTINVCLGKEWYRYPNSFFLPDSSRYRMRFIKSEFRGQLPKLYENNSKGLETRIVADDINDINREEVSRYTPLNRCHYLIDSDLETPSKYEPNYSQDTDTWQKLSTYEILNPSNSTILFRSFYIPTISYKKNHHLDFHLLRNKNLFDFTRNKYV